MSLTQVNVALEKAKGIQRGVFFTFSKHKQLCRSFVDSSFVDFLTEYSMMSDFN
jgi:hypothetical protein